MDSILRMRTKSLICRYLSGLTNESRMAKIGFGIGFLRQRVVVIVFVERPDDTIRVVSLRKALKHERERFAEFFRNQLGAG